MEIISIKTNFIAIQEPTLFLLSFDYKWTQFFESLMNEPRTYMVVQIEGIKLTDFTYYIKQHTEDIEGRLLSESATNFYL